MSVYKFPSHSYSLATQFLSLQFVIAPSRNILYRYTQARTQTYTYLSKITCLSVLRVT